MSMLEITLPENLSQAIEGRLALAVQLAIRAGEVTLHYFRNNNYQVDRKRDRSPVTQADIESETTIRNGIAEHFPEDTVSGEELGTIRGSSEFEWIIDPIDGTKSFISGVPLYSTLIGLTKQNEPCIGVIYIPALREIVFAAVGKGAWYQMDGGTLQRATVSRQSVLSDSLFVTSEVANFGARSVSAAYTELERAAYITRSWGDGYGYLLVATGRAEIMVDPLVHPWDAAAVIPVIEEAEGRCTDWSGKRSHLSGDLVATNGLLHEEVLNHLAVR